LSNASISSDNEADDDNTVEVSRNVIIALVCVVIGSALGGAARYFVSGVVARRLGETFPWGTMAVNVTGAFLIGILGALASNGASLFASSNPWLFAVTGFLGCYTTVSSFSLQTLALARDGEAALAVGNVVFSVLFCLGAVACGFAVAGFFR
jgi:CrcB protein